MALHVYYLNHEYFADAEFQDFDSAVSYAKSKGFEASIVQPYTKGKPHKGCEVLGHWHPLNGLTDRRNG